MAPDRHTNLEHLAAASLRKQMQKLSREAARVRSCADIEPLHQVRVATRRLRSALVVFADCFPREKTVRRWQKALRRLTRRLGRLRDLDVQIEFVRTALEECDAASLRPGIARLRLRLEQRRARLDGYLKESLQRFAADGVVDDMVAAADQLASAGGSRDPCAPCRTAILDAFEKLAAYRFCLLDPEDTLRHHAMRIKAKRLRYMLETCHDVYGRRLKPMIDAARKLQTLLGDLHDCDVWLDDLAAFEKAEGTRTVEYFGHDRPFARLKPGLDYLAADRRGRRDELFHELGAAWRTFEQQGLWQKLAALLDAAAAKSAPPKDAAGDPPPAPPAEDARPSPQTGRPVNRPAPPESGPQPSAREP